MKYIRSGYRQIAIGISVVLSTLLVPAAVMAAPPTPLIPGSSNAAQFGTLFWPIFAIAAAIFVIVESLLIFAIVRFRRRYPDEMPEQLHGNSTLELVWTIIPTLILIGVFIATLNVLQQERNVPSDAMVIEITGNQWYWTFEYPETTVKRDSRTSDLYIPVDQPVEFQVGSNDVIHSFWVPQLNGKMDAIPGHVKTLWVGDVEEGVYVGQCSEFCGIDHWNMLFDVVAVSGEEFDTWMAEQIEIDSQFTPVGTDVETIINTLPEGSIEQGEQLYEELGCLSCHSLDGTALVGPSIQGLSDRATNRVSGYSAEQYLIESIVLPCEFIVDTFTCVMPQNFGTEQLELQDMADLLAYLEEQ